MTPQVGSLITWKRGRGPAASMVVDAIYEVDGQRWLLSAIGPAGEWTAVNQQHVLVVKKEHRR